MPERARARLTEILAELATAVAADAGATLYLDDGDGALGEVASIGQPGGRLSWPDRLRRKAESRVLVVPVPDRSGGVVVLERVGSKEFSRDDRALAALYARQLTGDVAAGVRLQSSWTRQLEAIHRIAAHLTRLPSSTDVGTAICRETRQVIDYDQASVLLLSDDGRLRQIASTHSGQTRIVSLPLDSNSPLHAPISAAFVGGAPVLCADLAGLSETAGPWSVLVVPLCYERRVTGVICLLKEGAGQLDDDDVRLVQVLADQAAVAIQNARLMARSDELIRELNALLDVSTAATQPSDEGSLAAVLASKVRRASRADGCLIWRWQDSSTLLLPLAADGMEAPDPTDVAEQPARRTVLRDSRPLLLHSAHVADSSGQLDLLSLETGPESAALAGLGYASALFLPLLTSGRSVGMIELYSRAERWLDEAEMNAYQTMASSVAAGLENARLLEQLRAAADIDQLTGVNNHRYLQDRLRQEAARAARSRSPLCVLMIDLDKFKPINDRYGHAEGDRVLRSVADAIRGHVRTNDIVARYGGDEFVVVMPDTARDEAREVARRVAGGIRQRSHQLTGGQRVALDSSVGLSIYPEDGRTAAELLEAADAAMYQFKRAVSGQREEQPLPVGGRALAGSAG